ncbi:hypothetical protein IMZ48_03505 [Candidatus Bathyarchaeota archaeon]|nr:hypothetical protein [Candidatus Bathyarchaeota archaeon]
MANVESPAGGYLYHLSFFSSYERAGPPKRLTTSATLVARTPAFLPPSSIQPAPLSPRPPGILLAPRDPCRSRLRRATGRRVHSCDTPQGYRLFLANPIRSAFAPAAAGRADSTTPSPRTRCSPSRG